MFTIVIIIYMDTSLALFCKHALWSVHPEHTQK